MKMIASTNRHAPYTLISAPAESSRMVQMELLGTLALWITMIAQVEPLRNAPLVVLASKLIPQKEPMESVAQTNKSSLSRARKHSNFKIILVQLWV